MSSQELLEYLKEELRDIRNDIKSLRGDLHGLMWRVVGISSITGTIGAILAMLFHR